MVQQILKKNINMSFETVLQEVRKRAEKASSFGNSIKFHFGDEGCIILDGTNGPNVVSTEDRQTDCTVNVNLSDFAGMMDGSVNPMMAFMMGKLKVDGDMSIAMKLQTIM